MVKVIPFLSRRWWLLVIAGNTVIYNQAFRTKAAARRYGEAVTHPPLNRYELRKV